jgi:hypothetical protein
MSNKTFRTWDCKAKSSGTYRLGMARSDQSNDERSLGNFSDADSLNEICTFDAVVCCLNFADCSQDAQSPLI